jgi:CheY-like chemotaxis protein
MLVRILIADGSARVRQLLKSLLQTRAGWQVCGEAANGLEAAERASELRPDVVILDLSMPEMDGLQAASRISAGFPHVPILIFTQHAVPPEAKLEAKKQGVTEVISKEAPEQLISAIDAAIKKRSGTESDKTPSPMTASDLPAADIEADSKEN